MRASLLVPGPLAAISGGYGYDRRMLAEWAAAGHEVSAIELSGRHPLADAEAEAQAAASWAACVGVPIIDGLGLPAFAGMEEHFAARGAVGLIHHPTCMEEGTDSATAEALRAIETRLFQALPRIVVTSETTAATLVQGFGVAAERITTVVPGTEDAPRSAGSAGTGCRILAVGSLIPRKGHDLLLKALGRLFDLDWQLTIAGGPLDSAYAHELVALAEGLGIAQRVRFAGPVVDGALEALWREADVFALATRYEGYGMAIAEAMKRGLPVAVTKGGAVGALVPMEAGVACEVDDLVTYSKALRRVIFDVPLRAEMAEASWQAGQRLPGWAEQARLFAAAIGGAA